MHNVIEYSNNYSKTSRSLWKFYRHEPALDGNGAVIDFLVVIDLFTFGSNLKKITGWTRNNETNGVEIIVPLKYLSHF